MTGVGLGRSAWRLGPITSAGLLGLAATRNRLPPGARRLHHLAYAASLGSATREIAIGEKCSPATWVELALLALLPATGGGSRAHRSAAVAAILCSYAAAVRRR